MQLPASPTSETCEREMRASVELQSLKDLGQIRDVDLIEPGEDEEYVFSYLPAIHHMTLQPCVHRTMKSIVQILTTGEPVVLVTEVVEVLHRVILDLIQTNGVVGTVSVDDSTIYQEIAFVILLDLLHPDIL